MFPFFLGIGDNAFPGKDLPNRSAAATGALWRLPEKILSAACPLCRADFDS
jgi:hypothetical protein